MIPSNLLIPTDVPAGAGEELAAQLRARYGLDQPLHTQFLLYMSRAVRLDIGKSIRTRRQARAGPAGQNDIPISSTWRSQSIRAAGNHGTAVRQETPSPTIVCSRLRADLGSRGVDEELSDPDNAHQHLSGGSYHNPAPPIYSPN